MEGGADKSMERGACKSVQGILHCGLQGAAAEASAREGDGEVFTGDAYTGKDRDPGECECSGEGDADGDSNGDGPDGGFLEGKGIR